MGEAYNRAEAQTHRAKEERKHHFVRKHVPTVGQLKRPSLRVHPLALFVVGRSHNSTENRTGWFAINKPQFPAKLKRNFHVPNFFLNEC